jgi:hypothetical protein
MSFDSDQLYRLLPAIYRVRDEEMGGALKSFMAVLAQQLAVVQENLEQRYDDHFIETCADWLIPYLGDLVGNTPLFDVDHVVQRGLGSTLLGDLTGPAFVPEIALRNRADVAKTVHYRRRKATRPMLEELASDVTGWGAHVVEMFQRLGWTQYVRNHLRPQCRQCPDLRRPESMDRIGGPFDGASHTADLRPFGPLDGRYNIGKIGVYLWRLLGLSVDEAQARPVGADGDYRFTISPLGNDIPLFSRWVRGGTDGVASEAHLAGPIRCSAFHDDLEGYRTLPTPQPGFSEYYGQFGSAQHPALPSGTDASLFIVRDGVPVPPESIRCLNLSTWGQPSEPVVAVDVQSGRIAFGTGLEPKQVDVFYTYGSVANLGGGGYDRAAWLVRQQPETIVLTVDACGRVAGSLPTITAAIATWTHLGKPDTIISVLDSKTYTEPLSIEPADGRSLCIEAANRQRPHIKLVVPLTITGNHPDASLTLSGLLVEGTVRVVGRLGRLRLLHTTLVPGWTLEGGQPAQILPSIVVEDELNGHSLINDTLSVEMAFSISGPWCVPRQAAGLVITDSIVDGIGIDAIADASGSEPFSAPAIIERSTILGSVHVVELRLATEALFAGPVFVMKRQEGCVRFSFLPSGSVTPRRYRCQPDQEIARQIAVATDQALANQSNLTQADLAALADEVRAWLLPSFTSTCYGEPAYGQLHTLCPVLIQQGAEDGSEMGATCHLKQPQRTKNLLVRLKEYLPFGLEAAPIFVT